MTPLLALLTPVALNIIMGIVKWLGLQGAPTPTKRFLLAVFSIVGVIAANSLNGTPVDMSLVATYWNIAVEAAVAFVAAHGAYTLFWQKPAVQ